MLLINKLKVFEKDNSTFDNNGKFLPHIKNGIESFYTWFYKMCEMSKQLLKIEAINIREKSYKLP